MTTTVVSTIKPSGGDYSSLSAWFAAKQGNLTSADQIQKAVGSGFSTSGLSDTVTLSGATTDSTRYYWITSDASDRLDGTLKPSDGSWSGFKVTNDYNGPILTLTQDYSRVDYVGVYNPHTSQAYPTAVQMNAVGCRVVACVMQAAHNFVGQIAGGSNNLFQACIAFAASAIIGYSITSTGAGGQGCENCVAVSGGGTSNGYSNLTTSYPPHVQNCVAMGFTTSYYHFSNTSACSNNAASDGATTTPPGTGSLTSNISSSDFNATTTGDYHLSGTGSLLYHAGVVISGLTTDLDGDAFDSSTPSIGFDEYITGGGGTTVTLELLNGAWSFSAKSPQQALKANLGAGNLKFSGEPLAVGGAFVLALAAGALSLVAEALSLNAGGVLALAAGALLMTAYGLSSSVVMRLATASLKFSAKAVTFVLSTILQLGYALFRFSANSIALTSSGGIGGALTAFLMIFKRRRK